MDGDSKFNVERLFWTHEYLRCDLFLRTKDMLFSKCTYYTNRPGIYHIVYKLFLGYASWRCLSILKGPFGRTNGTAYQKKPSEKDSLCKKEHSSYIRVVCDEGDLEFFVS